MPSALEVRARNALRRIGVEVIPTRRRAEVNLLGLHLSRLFDGYAVDVVLDVGARVGEYGTWLRQNGYQGWIVSFEPVRASVEQLGATAASDPRWLVMPYALGSEDTAADIHVAAMSQLSSLLPVTEYGAREFADVVATDHTEQVQVRRLDSIWNCLPTGTVYLKLDTQGYDLHVLEGAGDRLADVVALQTEAAVQSIYDGAPTHLDTLEALGKAGFVPSGMFPVSLDDRLALVEYDLVAVRSG